MGVDRSSKEAVWKHAKRIEGKTLGGISNEARSLDGVPFKKVKGKVGKIVEEYFTAKMGSRSLPDLPEIGWEIKTCPLKPDGKTVDQPVTLNMFDYCREISACKGTGEHKKCNEIKKSSLYKKGKEILFVFYVRDKKNKPASEWRIKHVYRWKMDSKTTKLLSPDYDIIVSRLRNSNGLYCKQIVGDKVKKCIDPENCKTNLHQEQNKYLTTCPKHQGGFHYEKNSNNSRIQPFSAKRAESRAFRLKKEYMQKIVDGLS